MGIGMREGVCEYVTRVMRIISGDKVFKILWVIRVMEISSSRQ